MTARQGARILLVCTDSDAPTTGFAVRVKLIADSLAKAGATVVVLRLPNFLHRTSWAGTMPLNVDLIEIPMPPGFRLGIFIALAQFVRSIIVHLVATLKKSQIIQAENTISGEACTFIRWSKTPIIVDLHGAVVEEAAFSRGEAFKKTAAFNSLIAAERRCVEKADLLFVVAEPMIHHLKNKYPQLDRNKIRIIPVAADNLFFAPAPAPSLRTELGFSQNDLVFVYSGGAQPYQCIEETLSIFSKILINQSTAKLLILTIDPQKIRSLIEDSFIRIAPNTVIKSLGKDEVPAYLQIADMGFLLRHDEILNTVSCPTKFAEYIACGVAVITTSAAGHAPAYVKRFGTGIVIDLKDEDAAARSILSFAPSITPALRKRCREIASQHLNWEQAAAEIERNHELVMHG